MLSAGTPPGRAAHTHGDATTGYRVDFPESWQVSRHDETGFHSIVGLSPDDMLAVSVVAVPGDRPVTPVQLRHAVEPQLLADSFDGGQVLYTGADSLAGLEGLRVGYGGTWAADGRRFPARMQAFYTASGNTAFVLWWMTPAEMVPRRRAEAEAVLRSFRLAGPADTLIEVDPPVASSSVPDAPEHRVVIGSAHLPGETHYTLRYAGHIEKIEGRLDGFGVTIDDYDKVSDGEVRGFVRDGNDGYRVKGQVLSIDLDVPANADIYIDGRKIGKTGAAATTEDACGKQKGTYADAVRAWHASGRDAGHRRRMLLARKAFEDCLAQARAMEADTVETTHWRTRGLEGRDWDLEAAITISGRQVSIAAQTFYQGAWRPWQGKGTREGDTIRFDYTVEDGNTYGWRNGSGALSFNADRTMLSGQMRSDNAAWSTPVVLFRQPAPDAARAAPEQGPRGDETQAPLLAVPESGTQSRAASDPDDGQAPLVTVGKSGPDTPGARADADPSTPGGLLPNRADLPAGWWLDGTLPEAVLSAPRSDGLRTAYAVYAPAEPDPDEAPPGVAVQVYMGSEQRVAALFESAAGRLGAKIRRDVHGRKAIASAGAGSYEVLRQSGGVLVRATGAPRAQVIGLAQVPIMRAREAMQ
ncbi:hypothetical protein [Roseovarius salinarum]|uniref:hypothetical protein n=1 Tax=Roseovarius salinarum TaxID=1981892 RepID=UPI000C31EE64|nr:hypothetical protein [Roseovarius salinarum]